MCMCVCAYVCVYVDEEAAVSDNWLAKGIVVKVCVCVCVCVCSVDMQVLCLITGLQKEL